MHIVGTWQTVTNKWTTNGYRIKMFWGPRVKASHNVNHVEEESRMRGNSQPLDKAMKILGLEGKAEPSTWQLGSGGGEGQHMLGISCSLLAQQVSRGSQRRTKVSFLSLLTRIRYMCKAEVVQKAIF